jgi:hypothetical protein
MKNRKQINNIKERQERFGHFNEWELRMEEKPDSSICLAAVSELYELLPDHAKQRSVNVNGITKMRESLACLV